MLPTLSCPQGAAGAARFRPSSPDAAAFRPASHVARACRRAAGDRQSGAVLDLGLTRSTAGRGIRNGRWRPARRQRASIAGEAEERSERGAEQSGSVLPGVYATFTGPVPPLAGIWAAVLYAGPGACASHGTALWLAGLPPPDAPIGVPPMPLRVLVPHDRRVVSQPGVLVRRSRSATEARHPAALPPRVRIERAKLDVAAECTAAGALDMVLRATQRRLTNVEHAWSSRSSRHGNSARPKGRPSEEDRPFVTRRATCSRGPCRARDYL
jgi:hypothetical protein